MKRGKLDGADCASCPLARNGRPHEPVCGYGAEEPKFLVIGEGPGVNERRQGKPFVGESGQILNLALKQAGVSRDEVYVSNVTACQPLRGEGPKERLAAAKACSGRWLRELSEHPNKPVWALGGVAAQAILGEDEFKITDRASTLHRARDRAVIPSIHPAAILRGGVGGAQGPELIFWNLAYDAGKVGALAAGRDIEIKADLDLFWDRSLHDPSVIEDAFKYLEAEAYDRGWFAFDVETSGIGGRDARSPAWALLNAVGFGFPHYGLSCAIDCMTPFTWEVTRRLLEDPAIEKVAHNRIYEDCVTFWHFLRIRGVLHDTLLQHHVLFPGLAHDLQTVVSMTRAVPPWKSEYRDGGESLEEHAKYNALDCVGTACAHEAQIDMVRRRGYEPAYTFDLRMAAVAARCHRDGLPISIEENQRLHAELLPKIEAAKAKLSAFWEVPDKREAFLQRLAMEQAKKPRKVDVEAITVDGDTVSARSLKFDERVKVRLAELRKEVAKAEEPYEQRLAKCQELAKKRRKGKDVKKWDPEDYDERVQKRLSEYGFHFNLGSQAQVPAYLLTMGVPLFVLTDKGSISTKKDILEELVEYDVVRALLDYRESQKIESTFVRPIPRIVKNGRLHVAWSVSKISTRWGSQFNNVQNWPKQKTDPVTKQELRPNTRRQVVAPPGRKLVYADKSQLEARMIALLSGDPFLCKVFIDAATCEACKKKPRGKFCADHDIHSVCARQIWSDYDGRHDKDECRDLTKRAEYGAFYGAELETMYKAIVKEGFKVSKKDVARIYTLINKTMAGVVRWHEELLKEAHKTKQLVSLVHKRRRCFPLGQVDVNTVYNWIVQTSGTEIFNMGLDQLEAELDPDDKLCGHFHDAVLLEVAEDRAEIVRDIVDRAMNNEFTHNGITIPFPSEVKVGTCWAQF